MLATASQPMDTVPATTSTSIGAAPRYGTGVIGTPEALASADAPRWPALPSVARPRLACDGLALAHAMYSRKFLYGCCTPAAITVGTSVSTATGTTSLSGSYDRRL